MSTAPLNSTGRTPSRPLGARFARCDVDLAALDQQRAATAIALRSMRQALPVRRALIAAEGKSLMLSRR
jgi:hypothetical protein